MPLLTVLTTVNPLAPFTALKFKDSPLFTLEAVIFTFASLISIEVILTVLSTDISGTTALSLYVKVYLTLYSAGFVVLISVSSTPSFVITGPINVYPYGS